MVFYATHNFSSRSSTKLKAIGIASPALERCGVSCVSVSSVVSAGAGVLQVLLARLLELLLLLLVSLTVEVHVVVVVLSRSRVAVGHRGELGDGFVVSAAGKSEDGGEKLHFLKGILDYFKFLSWKEKKRRIYR